METEVLEVKILDIQEESFSINSEILSSLDQTDNTGIEFFISFKLNKNESVLVSEASLTYLLLFSSLPNTLRPSHPVHPS